MKRLFFLHLALIAAALPAQAKAEPTIAAILHDRTGDHRFFLEYAHTPEEEERGLMFRPSLAADSGMLFVFDPPYAVSMWMKNTEIPLDMLFLGADRRVGYIVRDAKPYDLTPLGNGAKAAAVIELPGGTADKLGISPGDRVDYRLPASP